MGGGRWAEGGGRSEERRMKKLNCKDLVILLEQQAKDYRTRWLCT